MQEFTKEVKEFLEKTFGRLESLLLGCLDLKKCLENPHNLWYFLDVISTRMQFESSIKGKIHGSIINEKEHPVYLGKGSEIKAYTVIEGSLVVGNNTVIGPGAYFRGNNIIGDNCKIGRAEIKGSIILDGSKVPHHGYVGDSILGRKVNIGAGSELANLRVDDKNVIVRYNGAMYDTGRRKVGAFMEDNSGTGCNVVLNPGTYLRKGEAIILSKASYTLLRREKAVIFGK